MRLPGAVIVAFLAVAPLPAQYWSAGGFGNVVFPGLGHAPRTANPFGNFVFPAMPNGPSAVGNRYGSLVPGFRNGYGYGAGYGSRHNRASSIYAFPVFVGGYGYGNGYAPDQPAPPDQPQPNGPAAPAPPPVVINQYFGSVPPDQAPPPDAAANQNFRFYQAPSNNDAAPSDPSSYYLIAFKDHTIYSAVAYYTDGDTLHYFTAGNVHNQVSLSLVDRALTEQLNRQRNVDVRLPQ
jgi:hypothetical protein